MLFLSLTLLLTIVCHSADINTNNTEAYRAASRQQVLNARLALEEQRSRLTREYLNSPISTIVHSTKQERENMMKRTNPAGPSPLLRSQSSVVMPVNTTSNQKLNALSALSISLPQ